MVEGGQVVEGALDGGAVIGRGWVVEGPLWPMEVL